MRLFLYLILFLLPCTAQAHDIPLHNLPKVESINWITGDNGIINGDWEFRLNDIDAPEIGAVGTPNGAQCEPERILGHQAKEWAINETKTLSNLRLRRLEGHDARGRHLISISNEVYFENRHSVTSIESGARRTKLYQRWAFYGSKPLEVKPNWCVAKPTERIITNNIFAKPKLHTLEDWGKASKKDKMDYTFAYAHLFFESTNGRISSDETLKKAGKFYRHCLNKKLRYYKTSEGREYLKFFDYPRAHKIIQTCNSEYMGLYIGHQKYGIE